MATLKIVLSVLFIIVSLVITIVILFQEGKSAGLGTIAGVADTYWGKNKGRSKEGRLVKATIVCVVLFFIISIALNMGIDCREIGSLFYRINIQMMKFEVFVAG